MSSNPLYIANLNKEQKQSLLELAAFPDNPTARTTERKANQVVRKAIADFVDYEGKAADVAKLEEFVIAQFKEARNRETGRLTPVQDEILAMAKEKADELFAQVAGIELVKGVPSYLR